MGIIATTNKWRFQNAEEVRRQISTTQLKQIKQMYEQLAHEVTKQVAKGKLDAQRLTLLQRDIDNRIKQLNSDIQNQVVRDIRTVSNAVVEDVRDYLKKAGFKDSDIQEAFFYVPEMVVQNIITGTIYQKGWTLSGAIWGYNKKVQNTISQIVSNGTMAQKSAYEIAKDIESYVQPTASKKARTIISWRKARQTDVDAKRAKYVGEVIQDKYYPGGNIDYNALRLARTMVSHAYQQTFANTNKNNPFVIGYRWLTSNFHGRVCEVCKEYATTDHHGLGVGIFPKDDFPLDHPNGMCTFEAVTSDDMETIADKIGLWYQSPSGTFPDIDRYARDFVD